MAERGEGADSRRGLVCLDHYSACPEARSHIQEWQQLVIGLMLHDAACVGAATGEDETHRISAAD